MKGCTGALALLAITVSAGARAATLWIEIPAGAAPCDLDQLEGALRSHVGAADVRPGLHDVDGSDVAVALERAGDRWTLRVRAAGERELRRRLPPAGADCVALSETAASMVERYLDDIRWTGGTAVVAPLPAPAPQPATPWQILLEAGGSAAIETLGVTPAAQLDVGSRHGALDLELTAALAGSRTLPVTTDPSRAAIAVQTSLLQLSAGYVRALGFGALRFEAAPGAELIRAQAAGSLIFGATPQTAILPFLGGRFAYELPLGRRFRLTARVEARALFTREAFSIDLDPSQTRATTPAVDGDAGLSLGYLFF